MQQRCAQDSGCRLAAANVRGAIAALAVSARPLAISEVFAGLQMAIAGLQAVFAGSGAPACPYPMAPAQPAAAVVRQLAATQAGPGRGAAPRGTRLVLALPTRPGGCASA